jgi:hypothetical protein
MKKNAFIIIALAVNTCMLVNAQNTVTAQGHKNAQAHKATPDSVFKDGHRIITGNVAEYSIVSYKNVNFLKADPFELESAGLHPEIYISNTHRGVIIISTSETNDALNNFSRTLELNTNNYESRILQDTLVLLPASNSSQIFDFTKASSINHDYKNAFNYKVDPRTGVNWSQSTHKDFLQEDILGKIVYDLIIVLPKK